jgi:hypothetical protein
MVAVFVGPHVSACYPLLPCFRRHAVELGLLCPVAVPHISMQITTKSHLITCQVHPCFLARARSFFLDVDLTLLSRCLHVLWSAGPV